MCVCQCDSGAQRDCVGQSRLECLEKLYGVTKAAVSLAAYLSAALAATLYCLLECNRTEAVKSRQRKQQLLYCLSHCTWMYVCLCTYMHVQSKSYLIAVAGRNTISYFHPLQCFTAHVQCFNPHHSKKTSNIVILTQKQFGSLVQ